MAYSLCCLVVVCFTFVNFDPWFGFWQRSCLHFVLCYGKGNDKWKKFMLIIVLNLQTNKDIFSIIRRKQNNHVSLIFLTKCVKVSLLLRLNRIALQWNWTPCRFLYIHKVYLQNQTINCTVTVIKLQYIFGGGVKGRAGKKGEHCARKNMCFVLQKQKLWLKPRFWKF